MSTITTTIMVTATIMGTTTMATVTITTHDRAARSRAAIAADRETGRLAHRHATSR